MVAGMNQNPPAATIRRPVMMPPLYPSLSPATRRQRHQEVAQIVRELHPGGLGQAQVQLLLEVLVHHVDHPVAEAPEGKQQDEEDECEEDIPAVVRDEHALSRGRGPSRGGIAG